MGEWEDDKEEDPRKVKSYPLSPRGYKEYDDMYLSKLKGMVP